MAGLLQRYFTTRRLIKALDRMAAAQEAQTALLKRLADRFAPLPEPEPLAKDLRQHSGVSFSRDHELARIEDFAADVRQKVQREPTEQEVVEWLEGREVTLG